MVARTAKRLSARFVATRSAPGKYADGDGLYFAISQNGVSVRKRWLFYFTWHGRRREMGLGSAREISLAEARVRAEEARRLVREGIDPIAARNQSVPAVLTFGQFASLQLYHRMKHGGRQVLRVEYSTVEIGYG